MPRFSSGPKSFGFCDRCGFRYNRKDLKGEYVRGRPVGNKVCPTCWDLDHEQNFLGDATKFNDSQSLEWVRPDLSLDTTEENKSSRALFSWQPVGSNMFPLKARLGKVTVVTT